MGLDTTWYRGLKKREDVIFDGDGEPTNVDQFFRPYVNSEFPGREGGIEHKAIYEYEDAGEGIRRSYSGYNHWREWLAKLAGYPEQEFEEFGAKRKSHAASTWYGPVNNGPFYELINFSDCEGVIGSEAAAKLAKDFAEWDERAKAADQVGGMNYDLYQKWRHSFEQAAQNGAVDFH